MFKIFSSLEQVQLFCLLSIIDLVVYSFFIVKECISSVKLEFSVWMVDQNSLTREVWVLFFFRDEYKGIPREFVVNTEVVYFSTFCSARKKLSLMSLARDTRL